MTDDDLVALERAGWEALRTSGGAEHDRSRLTGQPPFTAVVSSTYVHDGSAWRLAFHQQSP